MAFDTPARIAVLGAGPIGLEAALYARYLGYDVDIYERGYVAENVRKWGHVSRLTPFVSVSSPLGRAAIEAQDPDWSLPAFDALLTGSEWLDRYLLPLSQTDLLQPHLLEQREVIAVGHEEFGRTQAAGVEIRADYDFQLLIRDSGGNEHWASADIVIDATGVFGNANYLGPAGMPAAGELSQRSRIEYGLPDVLGRDRPMYAGKRVLLVGADFNAASTLVSLARLAETEPGMTVVWLTPPCGIPDEQAASGPHGETSPAFATSPPIVPAIDDPFPARSAVISEANQLAATPPAWLTWSDRGLVRAIRWLPELGHFVVKVSGTVETEYEVERTVASVGYQPDYQLSSELRLEIDAWWEAPTRLAAGLAAKSFDERLGPAATNSEVVLTSEPNFYILGAKSYGRHPGFLFTAGLEQIRALFSIIGERADLNLYGIR